MIITSIRHATLPKGPTDGPPIVGGSVYDQRIESVLQSIDWSKRDIVIYVPSVGKGTIGQGLADAIRGAFNTRPIALPYQADWRVKSSIPDGVATLRGVLIAIRAHGGNHRIHIVSEGQGAWVAKEVLADRTLRPLIHRSVLFGIPPGASRRYQEPEPLGMAGSANVLEWSSAADPEAADLGPDNVAVTEFIDALGNGNILSAVPLAGQVLLGSISKLGDLFGLVGNIRSGTSSAVSGSYDAVWGAAAVWLKTGRRTGQLAP